MKMALSELPSSIQILFNEVVLGHGGNLGSSPLRFSSFKDAVYCRSPEHSAPLMLGIDCHSEIKSSWYLSF